MSRTPAEATAVPVVDPATGRRRVRAALAGDRAARCSAPLVLLRRRPMAVGLTGGATCSAARCRSARSWSACCCSSSCSAATTTTARSPSTSSPGSRPAASTVDLRPALRPAVGAVPAADHRRRLADPRLLDRLHGARPAPAPLLRLPQPVRRRDADAGARGQLPRPVPRLGGRRPGVVPADRLLAAQALRRRGRQEGVRHQPGRRHRPVAGHRADVRRPSAPPTSPRSASSPARRPRPR